MYIWENPTFVKAETNAPGRWFSGFGPEATFSYAGKENLRSRLE